MWRTVSVTPYAFNHLFFVRQIYLTKGVSPCLNFLSITKTRRERYEVFSLVYESPLIKKVSTNGTLFAQRAIYSKGVRVPRVQVLLRQGRPRGAEHGVDV